MRSLRTTSRRTSGQQVSNHAPRPETNPISILRGTKGAPATLRKLNRLPAANEEKQLRLGLGQVLRYADQLGRHTVPVLMLERCPVDTTWMTLCDRLGVV